MEEKNIIEDVKNWWKVNSSVFDKIIIYFLCEPSLIKTNCKALLIQQYENFKNQIRLGPYGKNSLVFSTVYKFITNTAHKFAKHT